MNEMMQAAQTSLTKQGENITKLTTLARVKGLLGNDQVKEKFNEVLKDKAPGFIASITSLVSSSQNFEDVDANTIMQSAMVAATLDLPINPNLGFAYVVPYAGKAQFQMGWKGFVQLALRTGQYRLLNAIEVYEGELISRNKITGEIVLDETKRISDKVIGFVSFFRLVNGFEKTLYMSAEEMEKHAKRYSQTYKSTKKWVVEQSKWTTDFDAMALKTVIKLLLSKYGILSVQLQKAIQADQAVISETKDGEAVYEYVDSAEEIEAEVVDEKKAHPEDASDKNNQPEIPFNPEEENDPDYWAKLILECPKKEWKKFKEENKVKMSVFTGKDEERLNKLISEKDEAVKGK